MTHPKVIKSNPPRYRINTFVPSELKRHDKKSNLGEIRKEGIKKRKNFFSTLLITGLLWFFLLFLIMFTSPNNTLFLFLFFFLFFLATFFSTSIIFFERRRGYILSSSLTLFLILRYFGVGNVLNLLLIAGVAIATEIYLTK